VDCMNHYVTRGKDEIDGPVLKGMQVVAVQKHTACSPELPSGQPGRVSWARCSTPNTSCPGQ
jgi:hypothetical protein